MLYCSRNFPTSEYLSMTLLTPPLSFPYPCIISVFDHNHRRCHYYLIIVVVVVYHHLCPQFKNTY